MACQRGRRQQLALAGDAVHHSGQPRSDAAQRRVLRQTQANGTVILGVPEPLRKPGQGRENRLVDEDVLVGYEASRQEYWGRNGIASDALRLLHRRHAPGTRIVRHFHLGFGAGVIQERHDDEGSESASN